MGLELPVLRAFLPYCYCGLLVFIACFYLECRKDMTFQEILFLSAYLFLEIGTKARCFLFHNFGCVELIRPQCRMNCCGTEHHFWRLLWRYEGETFFPLWNFFFYKRNAFTGRLSNANSWGTTICCRCSTSSIKECLCGHSMNKKLVIYSV